MISKRKISACWMLWVLVWSMLSSSAWAQPPQQQQQQQQQQPGQAQQPQQAPLTVRPDYTLGPDDQVLIKVAQVPELNDRPFRIGPDGSLELPIVGKIQAGGLTVQAFEKALTDRLGEFVRAPQVYVSLAQFRGEPVFFVGAFRSPGIYPLAGRKTLVEMMTTVGGLQPNASRRIKITRRLSYGPIPLTGAQTNAEKGISTIDINIENLSTNINPEEDIALQPYDVVSSERAERVYVLGEVGRVTAIELGERGSISIAQALTEAGGLGPIAKAKDMRILRQISGTDRRAEIPIDAKRILAARDRDFPLLPNDVLVVNRSALRGLLSRSDGIGFLLPVILLSVFRRI